MFNKIISFSLSNKTLILVLAALLIGFGGYTTIHLPIDVLPDLNRPRVTVMTECPGMAPEEIAVQITRPIEMTLNGVIRGVTPSGSVSPVEDKHSETI